MEVFFGKLTPRHLHSTLSAFIKKERANCSTCLTHVPYKRKKLHCVYYTPKICLKSRCINVDVIKTNPVWRSRKKKERRSSCSPLLLPSSYGQTGMGRPSRMIENKPGYKHSVVSFLGWTTFGSLRGHFVILVWTFESVLSRIPISSVLSSSCHWRFTFHLFHGCFRCIANRLFVVTFLLN